MKAGQVGLRQRSPYSSRTGNVNPAVVHGKYLSLPREISSSVGYEQTIHGAIPGNGDEKSAKGILGDGNR